MLVLESSDVNIEVVPLMLLVVRRLLPLPEQQQARPPEPQQLLTQMGKQPLTVRLLTARLLTVPTVRLMVAPF